MSAKHDIKLYISKIVQYLQKERFKFKLILIYTHTHACMYTGIPTVIKYSLCIHIQQYGLNRFLSFTGLLRQYSLGE